MSAVLLCVEFLESMLVRLGCCSVSYFQKYFKIGFRILARDHKPSQTNGWGFVATLVYEGWADLPPGTSQNRPQPDRVSPGFFVTIQRTQMTGRGVASFFFTITSTHFCTQPGTSAGSVDVLSTGMALLMAGLAKYQSGTSPNQGN